MNVGFPPELMQRLQAVAAREERTVPAMIRLLVRRGLEVFEVQ